MAVEGVEYEIIQVAGSDILPESHKKQQGLAEELCSAILNRFEEAQKLNLAFINSDMTAKEKLNAIISFKTAMMIPSLRLSMGMYEEPSVIRGANNVVELLNVIEQSIYALVRYEDSEVVDFSHPKIVRGFSILVEVLAEVMAETLDDNVLVSDIIEKMVTRLVGFEEELNKRFKGLSNKVADSLQNTFSKSYLDKNKDEYSNLCRLRDDLTRCLSYGFIKDNGLLKEVENKITTIESNKNRKREGDNG